MKQKQAKGNEVGRRGERGGAGRRHVIHICRVWGTRHGGSQYSRALVEELTGDGCEVTLLAEVFAQAERWKQVGLAAFFRRDWCGWGRRVWEVVKVFRLALGRPGVVVIVQGDLPRLTYLMLQRVVPLI